MKEVDGTLCSEGTGNAVDYEALGRGDLIRSANQHRFQVAEHLDQCAVRSVEWSGKEEGGSKGRREGRGTADTLQ